MPVVTITGDVGSDGDRIGLALAEQLGVRFLDRQALVQAANAYDATGLRQGAPELAERAPNLWERLNEERRRYAVLVRAVVFGAAAADNVVMLGYASGLLLREVRHVLKVRTVAPREVRLQRILVTSPLREAQPNRAAAEDALTRGDRDRKRFIRYLFNTDWDDPAPYDLVLNTRTITVQAGVDLLAGLVQQPEFQPTPESRDKLADMALGSQVEAVLMHDPNVWVENLRVAASGGLVTLAGQVLAEEDRELAEAAALRIEGVRAVRNDVAVQPPPLAGM